MAGRLEHHKMRYRYVFRVAGSYLVGSWLLLQVMDVTFARLGLPEWTERLFLLAVLVGFLPAVFFAWLADLRARRLEVEEDDALEKAAEAAPRPLSASRALDEGLPSLAVLPFANLSESEARGFLADGVTDEIVTLLSQVPDIFIISHNSVLAFKNRDADVRQVAEELCVRYILQGSVLQASGRIRVTAQLIEAVTGNQVWAEKYEGAEETVFDMQDEVAQKVAAKLGGEIMRKEIERIDRYAPENLDAWGHYVQAQDCYYRQSTQNLEQTVQHAERAIDMDPKFAQAWSLLAVALSVMLVMRTVEDDEQERARCEAAVFEALKLAPDHPRVLCECANANSNLAHPDRALDLAKQAVAKAPCFASATSILGVTYLSIGDFDNALRYLSDAMECSPRDSQMSMWLYQMSWAHTQKNELETALEFANRSVERNPDGFLAWASKANIEGQLGRIDEGAKSLARCKALLPMLTLDIAKAATNDFYSDPALGDNITRGLALAGLE